MSATPPQLVADRYRLVEPLGQGGMGRVWKARDEVLHRDVAIKELAPPPGLTPEERQEMRERSLREARAIARLNHVNVVRIFDVLRTDGDPWIVMEYVPSRSLQDVLATDGPVSPVRAAEIGLGMLGALRAAHRSGVVHRDVKPGNVLLAEDGRVVLTDFGLATVPGDPNVTRTGLVLGSPAYIAPERARDGTAGPEADLWSLGATLYAAVEGQSPYARPSAIGTLAALATEQPPPPRRAGAMKPVLNGLLRKDPRARLKPDDVERLLRRASGRQPRAGRSLLDGVRRPSSIVQREPRPGREREPATKIVPTPRLPADTAVPVIPGKTARIDLPAVEATPVEAVPPPAPVEESPPVQDEPEVLAGAPSYAKSVNKVPLLAGGAAVLVVVLGIVLIAVLNGGDDGERVPASQPSSAAPSGSAAPTSGPATPSPSASAALALPAGWRLHTDRTGFSVAVPANWSVSREQTMVFFRERGGEGRILGIDQTDDPKADPVADWTQQESRRRSDYRSYERVKIAAVDYFEKAADWEWVYTSYRGNRIHVVNRGFVTGPDQAYAIYWSTPDATWADNQDDFALIAASFRPASG